MTMTDATLLHSLVESHSHEAFAQIVSRYLGLVYSVAYRQVGPGGLAEEVTQATFLLLWQRPGTVRSGAALTGWLVKAAHLAALSARRQESRRKRREQQAAAMTLQTASADAGAPEMAALLDQALAHLSEVDRSAIALRYLQDLPLAQVAATLGLSESAATMRVHRALARLRRYFARAGLSLSATGLAGALIAQAIAPPAALATEVTAIAQAAAVPLTVATIAKGASSMLTLIRVKLTAAIFAGLIVLGSAMLFVRHGLAQGAPHAPSLPTSSGGAGPSGSPASDSISQVSDWRSTFSELYRLDPGQVIKFIPEPAIAQREEYWRARLTAIAAGRQTRAGNMPVPSAMMFMLRDGDQVEISSPLYIPSSRPGLLGVLRDLHLDVAPSVMLRPEVAPQFDNITLRGDWIVRDDTRGRWLVRDTPVPDSLWRGLEQILKEQTGRSIRFENRSIDRDCVVVSGRFSLVPLDQQHDDGVLVVPLGLVGPAATNTRDTTVASLLGWISTWTRCGFVDQTQSSSHHLRWGAQPAPASDTSVMFHTASSTAPASEPAPMPPTLDQMLQQLARRSSLQFTREKRSVAVIIAVED